MREIESKEPNGWLLWLGLLFCTFMHVRALHALPGLHFDEAWAMNFSWRIASEKDFWPLHAMSPYTAPWTHYWAALWMKIYPSLTCFRLSQVSLSLWAIYLCTWQLWKMDQLRAASFFPFVAGFLPGLYFNHRFAVELNGLHPFLFALLLWSLVAGRYYAAAAFFVIATTAHILFYGVGLAMLAACIWENRKFSRREKNAIVVSFGLLAVFFFRVAWLIPEKGKAAALVISALLAIGLPYVQHRLSSLPRWQWFPLVLGGAFLVNLVFFAEGTWSLGILTGSVGFGLGWQASLVVPLLAGLLYVGLAKSSAFLRSWFFFSLFFLGLMMLKPAPRYFELPLLAMAILLSLGLAWQRALWGNAMLMGLGVHALVLYGFFFNSVPFEKELRFLHFKDSSRDFLSKQKLTEFLGGAGCEASDIRSADSRVMEAVNALWIGQWWVAAGGCAPGPVVVSRSKEAPGKTVTIADFVVEGTNGSK